MRRVHAVVWYPNGGRVGNAPPVTVLLEAVSEVGQNVTPMIDLYTAPRFRESLAPVLLSAPPEVVIDLGGVEFIDSSGIGVMVGALKRLRAHDGRLTLTGVSATTRRALELVGLTKFMQIEPAALEEAGQR